jgi:hypothetical protein
MAWVLPAAQEGADLTRLHTVIGLVQETQLVLGRELGLGLGPHFRIRNVSWRVVKCHRVVPSAPIFYTNFQSRVVQLILAQRAGGIPLRWNKWVAISDAAKPIWNGRSEVVERLLAQKCELCGAEDSIEVHHIRRLADLECRGQPDRPRWARVMAARRRKALVVCQQRHNDIQYGRYDGPAISK